MSYMRDVLSIPSMTFECCCVSSRNVRGPTFSGTKKPTSLFDLSRAFGSVPGIVPLSSRLHLPSPLTVWCPVLRFRCGFHLYRPRLSEVVSISSFGLLTRRLPSLEFFSSASIVAWVWIHLCLPDPPGFGSTYVSVVSTCALDLHTARSFQFFKWAGNLSGSIVPCVHS